MDGDLSDTESLSQGVPQGLVLGLIAFTLYTTPLGDICRAHDILFQLYANDQLLLSLLQASSQGYTISMHDQATEVYRRYMNMDEL